MTGWTALSVPLSFAASVSTDLLLSIRRTTDLLASHSSPTHQQPKGPRVSCVPLAFAECAPPPVAFEVRSSKFEGEVKLITPPQKNSKNAFTGLYYYIHTDISSHLILLSISSLYLSFPFSLFSFLLLAINSPFVFSQRLWKLPMQ
jgi:hypothetical protein